MDDLVQAVDETGTFDVVSPDLHNRNCNRNTALVLNRCGEHRSEAHLVTLHPILQEGSASEVHVDLEEDLPCCMPEPEPKPSESGVATGTDPPPPPPSLSLSRGTDPTHSPS